jgi:hypothetical protein
VGQFDAGKLHKKILSDRGTIGQDRYFRRRGAPAHLDSTSSFDEGLTMASKRPMDPNQFAAGFLRWNAITRLHETEPDLSAGAPSSFRSGGTFTWDTVCVASDIRSIGAMKLIIFAAASAVALSSTLALGQGAASTAGGSSKAGGPAATATTTGASKSGSTTGTSRKRHKKHSELPGMMLAQAGAPSGRGSTTGDPAASWPTPGTLPRTAGPLCNVLSRG